MANRVRYAENGEEFEVRFFIYYKGLDLGNFPQLELQKIIEKALEEIE